MANVHLMHTVQKTLLRCKNIWHINLRSNSTLPKLKALECLEHRSLLQIRGEETSEFLQGLITNDMRHFKDGIADIYALFLNTKGRVLYDTIIYKTDKGDESYYIECDSEVIKALQKHLTIYKIRRKIDIQPMTEMKIWAVFDSNLTSEEIQSNTKRTKMRLEGQIFPCGSLNPKSSVAIGDVNIYEDPRIPDFSLRILTKSNVTRDEIAQKLEPRVSLTSSQLSYHQFRYQLGIGEGADDLPSGKALPLEINCDYLHGVSFHKGCYIGQELTARTHHTGIVRKRLMPLVFNEAIINNFQYDEKIVDESGKAVGKFRGVVGKHGLGLMRVVETMNAQNLYILNKSLIVVKPCWWPIEGQKEKLKVDENK